MTTYEDLKTEFEQVDESIVTAARLIEWNILETQQAGYEAVLRHRLDLRARLVKECSDGPPPFSINTTPEIRAIIVGCQE